MEDQVYITKSHQPVTSLEWLIWEGLITLAEAVIFDFYIRLEYIPTPACAVQHFFGASSLFPLSTSLHRPDHTRDRYGPTSLSACS